MSHRSLYLLGAAALIALSMGCSKSKAQTPTAPVVQSQTPADGSTLKASAPTPQSPVNDVRIETFTNPTLTASASQPTQGGNFSPQYRFQLLSDAGAVLEESSLKTTPSWVPAVGMDFDKRYRWQVRAEYQGDAGPWSSRASFLSPNGGFLRGKEAFDPLTNGKSVGFVHGGHFVTGPNGGWEADTMQDGVDYNIQTCDACRVEFDVTNFGNGEGVSAQVDVKWFSMGDGSTFGDFQAFRNSPWKMHIEQRSDGDGSGMQLIWRNGATDDDSGGDPDYGDHRGKFLNGGPNWGHSFDNKVWHFVIEWTRTTYKISMAENGGVPRVWFPGPGGDTGFFGGGHAYAPPNHRIQLGCSPRGETMVGARFRNFRITPL